MRAVIPGHLVSFGSIALAASLSAGLLGAEPASRSNTQTSEAHDLPAVLERASEYATRYFGAMTNLTAEERYRQELVGVRSMSAGPTTNPSNTLRTVGGERRELRSDIVLVKVGPPLEWRVYRDVFEVGGRPVRDRADRLKKLFLEPTEAARAQAERIAEESARFNISNMGRVLNEPGLPLAFLLPTLQPRFAFSLERRSADDVWIVEYAERAQPTLFWHNRTTQNPSSGRFRIDPRTGEIRQTEHVVTPPTFKATFVTEFRFDDRFRIAVPREMREQLWTGVGAGARRVQGVATYSAYRQFAVTTQEAPESR
jgi:hypothetical protein